MAQILPLMPQHAVESQQLLRRTGPIDARLTFAWSSVMPVWIAFLVFLLSFPPLALQPADGQTELPTPPSNPQALIREIQVGLVELGFHPGPIDGRFGRKTARAIAAYQASIGMRSDGRVDDALWQHIQASMATKHRLVREASGHNTTPQHGMEQPTSEQVDAEATDDEGQGRVSHRAEALYPPDIKKIIDRKTLRVGLYYKDKPPFVMTTDNGVLYGVDITLAQDLAKALGVGIAYDRSSKTYEELNQLVARGDVDVVICKFSRIYERAKYVRFSHPYVELRQGLLINRKFLAQKKIEKYPLTFMRNHPVKIGVRERTSYVEYAQSMFKKAQVIEGVWDDLVANVVSGKLDALLRDEYVLLKLLNHHPDIVLYTALYILKDKKDYIAIAVPFNSINLLAFINIYLESNNIMMNLDYLINKYPNIFKKDS